MVKEGGGRRLGEAHRRTERTVRSGETESRGLPQGDSRTTREERRQRDIQWGNLEYAGRQPQEDRWRQEDSHGKTEGSRRVATEESRKVEHMEAEYQQERESEGENSERTK